MRSRLRTTSVPASRASSQHTSVTAAIPALSSTPRNLLHSRRSSANSVNSHSRPPTRLMMTTSSPLPLDASSSVALRPYEQGHFLTIHYTPEGSSTPFPVQMKVLKAFTPFTVCQTLLVEPYHHSLPRKLVIKLADPRFSDPDLHARGYRSPWSTAHDAMFEAGIQNAKRGTWPNFWQRLGGIQTPWEKRPYVEEDDEPMETWADEMDCWDGILNTVQNEAAAYRALRPLQGTDVPILYGLCSFVPPDVYPGSLVTRVNGICMEFIDGARVDHMKIELDISEADARLVSRDMIDMMRRVRQLRLLHGDIYARNIMIRRDNFRPVLIDFGGASLQPPNETLEQWTDTLRQANEVELVRRLLKTSGWHNPSPRPSFMNCCNDQRKGHGLVNVSIESLRPDWRDEYYERIEAPPDEIRVDPEGNEYRWQPLRWRIRKDVKRLDLDDRWHG